MAMKVESSGFKVEGDLGDLQIVEDDDSDDGSEYPKVEGICAIRERDTLANFPTGLVRSGVTPIFGTVQVTNSDNAQFGNNTYFNGPVTIKQVIQSTSGIDNGSYQKTDDEDMPNRKYLNSKDCVSDTQLRVKTWHKVLLLAVIVIVLVCICAIVLVIQQNNHDFSISQDSTGKLDDLLIAPDHLRIVSRTDWLAQPVVEKIDPIIQPVPWVIITHTATEGCFTQSECVLRVRLMQTFHIESKGWSDIGYNFMVGGDGSSYVGRGWDQIGAHTKGYNKYAISIAFIGTFNTETPTKHQVDACQKLIKLGVAKHKLAQDYKLLAHRQLMSTLSPGDKVFEIISSWPHFYAETDITKIIPKY